MKMLAIHQINVTLVIVGVVLLRRMFVIYNWYYPRLLAVRRLVLQIEMTSYMRFDIDSDINIGIVYVINICIQSGDIDRTKVHVCFITPDSWDWTRSSWTKGAHIMCIIYRMKISRYMFWEIYVGMYSEEGYWTKTDAHTCYMLSTSYERGVERVCKGL